MEKRKLNLSFYKSGSGGVSTRLAIPKKWADELELTPDDRELEVSLDKENKRIIIEKSKK